MKIISIVVALVTLLTGCQSFLSNSEKAADIAIKAQYVDELVKTGAITDSLFDSDLSQDEIDAINKSLQAYNDFSSQWGRLILQNPLEAIKNTSTIINHYGVLRIHYAEIERIVSEHWDKYPAESQFLLLEYQKQARSLDELIMSLLAQSKTSTALIAIQRAGVVLGQIALKLI